MFSSHDDLERVAELSSSPPPTLYFAISSRIFAIICASLYPPSRSLDLDMLELSSSSSSFVFMNSDICLEYNDPTLLSTESELLIKLSLKYSADFLSSCFLSYGFCLEDNDSSNLEDEYELLSYCLECSLSVSRMGEYFLLLLLFSPDFSFFSFLHTLWCDTACDLGICCLHTKHFIFSSLLNVFDSAMLSNCSLL